MRTLFRLFAGLGVLLAASGRAAEPYGLVERPTFEAFYGGRLPAEATVAAGSWSAVVAFPGLTFLNPVGILPLPGTDRLVVWEREGRVYSFENDAAAATKTLLLDLHERCQGWGDQGLLGMAFHPAFAANRYVYLWYNWVPQGKVVGDSGRPPYFETSTHQRLSRFTYDPASGTLNPASEYILIEQIDQHPVHGGGGMFFHPDDGFLYLTNGDDANGANEQTISRGLFGCLLRIDVDRRGGAISQAPTKRAVNEVGPNWPAAYFIPKDNPFVGTPGALGEIFALGLRSPHRATVDPVSGRIFIGDVGDSSFEEINAIEPNGPRGLNFQWNRFEGGGGTLTAPYLGHDAPPLLAYSHSDGASVIGGYVYRGREFPELEGKYLFGDNVSNTIWYLDETTAPASKVALATLPRGASSGLPLENTGLSSFGHDANGELFLCQMSSVGGRIYKLSRTPTTVREMPLTLSETGVFSDLTTLQPATGFTGYDVNAPAWSDGAHKQRWFAVPSGKTIGYAPTGEWSFPDGSVFLKHFEFPVQEGTSAPMRRLETRILVRASNGGVYGGSYRWREDGSDADLVTSGFTEQVVITRAEEPELIVPWTYPGRQDCLSCHTSASGGVLGLSARQNHRSRPFPETGVNDNQLRAWSHAGYFSAPIDESSLEGLPRLAAIEDLGASVEHRARSYLDANCASCHRPGGVRSFWDARIETPLAQANIVDGFATNSLGISGARVVAAGDHERSVLLHRFLATGTSQMPPLARNVVDDAAAALLSEWILSVQAPEPPPLPEPWQHADIGDVTLAGSASVAGDAGFTMRASGLDISYAADAFHFVYRDLPGNGELTARVSLLTETNLWAKAGVMIRETLEPGSTHAMTALTPGNGAIFQRRLASDGQTLGNNLTGKEAPYWVSIRRMGSVFISSISADGVSWAELGRTTIAMGETVKVGLVLCSRDPEQLGAAAFDEVRFLPAPAQRFTRQPASVLARTGEAVAFDFAAEGLATQAYAWERNGTPLPEATDARLALAAVTMSDAGDYRVVLDGQTLSENAALAVVDRITGEGAIVAGTTATLEVQFAGAGLSFQWRRGREPIAGATAAQLAIANFSASDQGDNYYCAVALPQGEPRVFGPFSLRLMPLPSLPVLVSPLGAVRGPYEWALSASDPQSTFRVKGLPAGLIYDPIARAIKGKPEVEGTYLVDITAENPAGLSEPRTVSLTVEPFAERWRGTYVGLVDPETETNGNLGGHFELAVTSSGQLTGKLILAGHTRVVRGALESDSATEATFRIVLPRRGRPPLTFEATFDHATGTVTGAAHTGSAGGAAMSGSRIMPAEAAAPFAKTYNLALTAQADDAASAELSQGAGWLRARFSSMGAVILKGRLSNGTPVSMGARLRADQSLPMYRRIYRRQDALAGTARVDLVSGNSSYTAELSGAVDWRKAARGKGGGRRDGFALTLDLLGRDFTPPVTGGWASLNGSEENLEIEFRDGGLGAWISTGVFRHSFRVAAAGRAAISTTRANPQRVTLSVHPRTGVYAGSFTLQEGPAAWRVSFQGIFIPGSNTAPGFFMLPRLPDASPLLSGKVSLRAP